MVSPKELPIVGMSIFLKILLCVLYIICSGNGVVKYYSTFSNTIYDVLASRGWQEVEADEDVRYL